MKNILFSCLFLCCFSFCFADNADTLNTSVNSEPIDKENCTCKGKKLYGKVKIVSSGADFVVKITESAFYDIAVKKTNSSFQNNCGEWYFTDSAFYDFSVQFTESAFYDFSVKFTDSAFYGVR